MPLLQLLLLARHNNCCSLMINITTVVSNNSIYFWDVTQLVKKKIEGQPKRWHETLLEVLGLIGYLNMVLPKLSL